MPDADEKPTAEEKAKDKVPPPPDDASVTFTVERLRQVGDRTLGVPLSAIAGAFDGQAGSKEITVQDAKKRVRDWLKTEAEQPENAE